MPIKYIPFIPELVEGQAVLGNFNRILRYKGADELSMTLQRGMPLYEMEKQETVGENTDGNMVIRGECVSACAYLKEQGVQVDLVYIDPPFASGADYAKKVYIRRNPKVAEAIAQAERELDVDELKAFEEKMYGDVWDKEKYLSWMYENLMAIKGVMSENASIWVELDNHIGHYVKILLDEIFGENHFVNEIVWKRTFSHSDVGQGAKHLGRLHDVIFLYSMSDEYTLNTVYTPYSQEYIDNFFRYSDDDGRRYRLVSMIGTGGAAKGNPFYEFMGVSRYWRYSQKTIQELVERGLVVQTKPGAVPQKKNYLDESPGVPLQDICSVQDLKKTSLEIDKLQFSVPSIGLKNRDDLFEELLSHPQYIYAKPKNIDLAFAVDKIYPQKIITRQKNEIVVNGEVLYDHIDVIRAPNKKRHFELGSDITITANNRHFNVNYKFQGTLQEQIREMKLISAMMQKQPIYIGKVLMPVFSSLDFHGHTLDEVSNRLSALLRADATLKKLHVQKDLSLGSLTDKETSNLNYLVDGILDGSTVPLKCSEQPAVGKISIGNISLLLVLKKADNETGCFIRNFFEIDDLVLAGKDDSPEHGTRVSPYVLVTAEQLETIDNADL